MREVDERYVARSRRGFPVMNITIECRPDGDVTVTALGSVMGADLASRAWVLRDLASQIDGFLEKYGSPVEADLMVAHG